MRWTCSLSRQRSDKLFSDNVTKRFSCLQDCDDTDRTLMRVHASFILSVAALFFPVYLHPGIYFHDMDNQNKHNRNAEIAFTQMIVAIGETFLAVSLSDLCCT